jgi:hypothetical protein
MTHSAPSPTTRLRGRRRRSASRRARRTLTRPATPVRTEIHQQSPKPFQLTLFGTEDERSIANRLDKETSKKDGDEDSDETKLHKLDATAPVRTSCPCLPTHDIY